MKVFSGRICRESFSVFGSKLSSPILKANPEMATESKRIMTS